MIKLARLNALVFCSLLFSTSVLFAQKTDTLRVQRSIVADEVQSVQVYKGEILVYSGNFELPVSLPIGTHFQYSNSGRLIRYMEYNAAENRFEGIPNTLVRIVEFNSLQKVQRIIELERCVECDYSPRGTWKFYDAQGKYVEIDMSGDDKPNFNYPLQDFYWEYVEWL